MTIIINFLIFLNLYSQSPIINSIKQIDEKVRDTIVKNSPEIIRINNKLNDLSQSTTTISFQLNNEIQERVNNDALLQNQINSLNQSTQSLQQQINNIQISTESLSQYFIKRYGGDIIYDGLTSNGLFIANNGIHAYNNSLLQGVINLSGNTNINGTLKFTNGTEGEGKVLVSDNQGNARWETINISGTGDNLGNHIATTTLNMNNNSITNLSELYGNGFYLSNSQFFINTSTFNLNISPDNFIYYINQTNDNEIITKQITLGVDFFVSHTILNNQNITNRHSFGINTEDYINFYSLNSASIFYYNPNGFFLGGKGEFGPYYIKGKKNDNTLEIFGIDDIKGDLKFKGEISISSTNNPDLVFICSGGTLDGMLTINSQQCENALGVARPTRLRLGD